MIRQSLADPLSGKNVRVTNNLSLLVSDDGLPPQLDIASQRSLPRFIRFTRENDSGSFDMRVDGSVTPVEFSIKAELTQDLYVHQLTVVIADAGAALNEFGNIGVLTNGIELFWERDAKTVESLGARFFTNFDFIVFSAGDPAFGDAASAFRAANVVGTSDAFFPVVDFSKRFGMPYGILLRGGTNERLVFRINDNLTGVDRFDALITGFVVEQV